MKKIDADAVGAQEEKILKLQKAVQSKVSPAGALKLPEKLDRMRLEYMIPDGIFSRQPFWDRVFVYQLSETAFMEKYGGEGGVIVIPESVQAKYKAETARGILVAAGPKALDQIRSNGADLGDIVSFTHLAPYRLNLDAVDGHVFSVLVMLSGNLVASEDLEQARRAGTKVLEFDEESGQHYWTEPGVAKKVFPQQAWIAGDQ